MDPLRSSKTMPGMKTPFDPNHPHSIMSHHITLASHAKINLFLHVLGKRDDGFHAVRSLMLPTSLTDTIHFETLPVSRIELECSDPSLSTDRHNLVCRAAELLQTRHAPDRGARIRLKKRIPIGAGLGGGSSNGSTTLVGLNRLWNLDLSEERLEQLAAELGSDTAFFVRCQPALCEGRGEILTPTSFSFALPILLVNFGFGSATAWAYQNLESRSAKEETRSAVPDSQSLDGAAMPDSQFTLRNDLEIPVFRKFPILGIAKKFLAAQADVTGAMMCGSGSTMLAILRSAEHGEAVRKAVQHHFGATVWTWLGHTLPSPISMSSD